MTTADRHARDVLVVGESLVDIVQKVDGHIGEAPGGSPANVALTLGRLGRRPRLVTSLGDDARGRTVRAWLERSGVDVRAQISADRRTSTAMARLDPSGAAEYEFDLAWSVDAGNAGTADLLHVGSIAAVLEPGASHVERLVTDRRASATISFDPNIRPALIDDPAAARARIVRLAHLADVIKVSDEDLAWLHPGREPGEIAGDWLDKGAALVVITAGGEGAVGFTAQGQTAVVAPAVSVVDTVGAGDTFMGTLIDSLVEEGLVGATSRKELRRISQALLQRVLRRCAAAAAITVSRPGADPPTSAELADS